MANNTIIIKGDPIHKEAEAGGAITPGMLLAWSSGNLVAHAAAGGVAQKMVAIEQGFIGNGITDAYASGDQVNYVVARTGDELYMLLADGQTSAIGSPLVSDGAGALTVATVDATTLEGAVVGFATEVVAASGAVARITVEIA